MAWWWPTLSSSADCVSPTLSVSPAQGPPGTTVTISGQNWYEGCYDPSSPAATYQGAPPPRPDSDIRVTFSDGKTVFEIARVTPGGNGTFSFQAQVPDGAQPTNSGSFRADGTNGSPTVGFAVGPKASPPTTQPTTATTSGSTTATTARVSGSSSGSRASSTTPAASSVDFGTVSPAAPTSSVVFNPSTPLAPQITQATISPFNNALPSVSTPPVTLGSAGHSRRADVLWVLGFLALGAGAAVAYFVYQRRTNWRPRRF